MSLLDGFDEFAAEDLTENPYWEEELVLSWVYPVVVVLRQSTGGDNDPDHVSTTATPGSWILKLAEPYLVGLDAQHMRVVRMALGQLEMMQQEQVMVMMPAGYCVNP